jgi:hypothetical protein
MVFAQSLKNPEMKKILLFSAILLWFTCAFSRTGFTGPLSRPGQDMQDQPTATLKSASRLFKDTDDLTSVIMIIPANSVVTVTGSDSTYYKVKYEDTEGFVFKRHAKLNREQAGPARKNETVASASQAAPVQKSRGNRFSYLENKYGTATAALLYSGKIWKGMDSEMVVDSWGSPNKINKVIRGSTIREEWIYNNTLLLIIDNKLVDWGPAVKR